MTVDATDANSLQSGVPDGGRLPRHAVGRSSVRIPAICFGTSGLGSMPDTYGYDVSEQVAYDTIHAIIEGPSGFLDTSRNYGFGRSEERIGHVIRALGGLPDDVVLSTKLDRDDSTNRFDAAQARRSIEQSFETLGVDRVDILHLHDPEHARSVDEITATGGALDELFKMKEEGLCQAVGLAAGRVDIMTPILAERDFDVLITHNRCTVVNANAEPMLELAAKKGMSVMNAAPYAGGALAKGTDSFKRYVYQDATPDMLKPIQTIEALCQRHHVPPGAVALQFSMRHPQVTSTICGVSKPERIAQTLAWATHEIPAALWEELSQLERSTVDPESTRQYSLG